MKRFAIALFGLIGLVSAKPAFPFVTYASLMSPGAQIVTDDPEALDNPEIVLTRTQHAAAARVDRERLHLAGSNERLAAHRVQSLRRRSSLLADDGEPILASFAPLGADGRVVDTAEVAAARAAHAAAHANERLNLANEAARSGDGASSEVTDSAIGAPGTVGPEHDGALNAPEITTAGTVHASEKRVDPANGRFGDVLKRIADDDPAVPLVLRDGVVAALVPVGAPLDTSAIADQQGIRDVKSVDALAVAGPILAYGRLIY